MFLLACSKSSSVNVTAFCTASSGSESLSGIGFTVESRLTTFASAFLRAFYNWLASALSPFSFLVKAALDWGCNLTGASELSYPAESSTSSLWSVLPSTASSAVSARSFIDPTLLP